MDVRLRDLECFVALARHLHFGRAADELGISQPALSKQLRTLEGRLGTALVDRSSRTVALTPAGRALRIAAPEVLEAWSRTLGAVSDAAGAEQARIVIGLSTGVSRGIVPAIRKRLLAADGRFRIELRPVLWDDTTAGLGRNDRDAPHAAFVWLPLPEPARFEVQVVAEEGRAVALPACHRLAGRTEIRFAEIEHEPFLALPEGSGPLRDHFLGNDARDGGPARVAGTIINVEGTAEDVASGVGVCLLAEGNAPFLAREGITIVPVPDLPPSRLALAWRRGDRRPQVAALRVACDGLGQMVGR